MEFMYLDKNGNPKWKEWKPYLGVQGNDKLILEANNRRILKNEIVLDIEDPEEHPKILEQIKKDFEHYSDHKSGSRGYHIHLFFDEDVTPEEKKAVLEHYNTDIVKGNERNLIALENCPHFKTGKLIHT